MLDENKNVIPTRAVEITPAQEALLELVRQLEPKELRKSLKHVKEYVLYLGDDVNKDDRGHCFQVDLLEKALARVGKEFSKFKTQAL